MVFFAKCRISVSLLRPLIYPFLYEIQPLLKKKILMNNHQNIHLYDHTTKSLIFKFSPYCSASTQKFI